MATYDDGIPEDWYPGFFLDPRNAWKWMPSAIAGWLPTAMVRTPPATWPESGEPSSSPKPGLLDGLAELGRPKSFEEKLAEARKFSIIPDSLGGEPKSAPQPAPSSWLSGAQLNVAPGAAWPDVPTPRSVVRRDDAVLTPEMHRDWLDAYFRYKDSKPKSAPFGAGTSAGRGWEIPYVDRMTGAEPYLKRPDGSVVLNPAAWAPAMVRTPSGGVYLNPDAWDQPMMQALDTLGIPTRNLRGILYGEPPPPPPPLPDTPQKVPSSDPRGVRASMEMANIMANVAAALMPSAAAGFVGATRPVGRLARPLLEGLGILRPAARDSRYSIGKQLQDIGPLDRRPFERDYDAGVSSDATGKLLTDMDGNPFSPKAIVVGRQVEAGMDVPFPEAKQEYLAKKITGRYSTTLPTNSPELNGAVGKTAVMNGVPVEIFLSDELEGGNRVSVFGHELGHGLDESVHQIPVTKKMKPELEALYNTTNNPKRTPDGLNADPEAPLYTPKDRGYGPRKANREYMAEAFRIYMLDPNYLKSVAPETAAQIRFYINTHPRIGKIIQFNSALGVPVVGSQIPDEE